MRKIFTDKAVWLIFIVSSLLVFLWFKDGNLIGAAESALPFYNLNIYWNQTKFAWAYPALGNITGPLTASAPTYWLLSRIQLAAVPGFVIEALFFWFLIFVSGVSIYLLTRELFPQIKHTFALLAVGFYWFNPMFLVNVWNRFLYNYMVFIAFLPLALLLFLKGIGSGNFFLAMVFGFATFIFSYAFTSPVFNILLWLVLAYTLFFYFFTEPQNKSKLVMVIFFFLSFTIYILVNFWWLTQIFSFVSSKTYTIATSAFFSSTGNLSTLSILSESLGNLNYIVRLMHEPFFEDTKFIWSNIFTFAPFVILEFLMSGVIFWTTYRYRKLKSVLYLGSLFLILVFLTKGNNLPFGDFFQLLFIKFSTMQIFRNPFEKFGVLIPLAVSPLFAFGIEKAFDSAGKRTKIFVVSYAYLFVLVFWGFPFITGLLFTHRIFWEKNKLINYEVKVPDNYRQVNDWFNKQGGDFRFISFPLGDEGITYTWERPYSGVELSSTLFDTPSISFNTTIPFYESVVKELQRELILEGDFTTLMNVLNAKYILIRSDVDWKARAMRAPEKIKEILSSQGDKFKNILNIGQLSVWQNENWLNQKIFAVGDLVRSVPYPKISDFDLLESHLPVAIYSGNEAMVDEEVIVNPTYRFYQEFPPPVNFEERQDIFPYVKFLPSSPFYSLTLLKEGIDKNLVRGGTNLAEMEVSLLGKRLNEAKKENDRGNSGGVEKALSLYRKELKEFSDTVTSLNSLLAVNNRQVWNQTDLYGVFARHKKLLADIKTSTHDPVFINSIEETLGPLRQTLYFVGISPFFEYIYSDSFPLQKRVTYQFNVDKAGEYKVFMSLQNWKKFYEGFDKTITMQIDDGLVKTTGSVDLSGMILLGRFKFDKGTHDIGLNTPPQKDLVYTPNEFTLSVEHGIGGHAFEIKNFDPFAKYKVNFEYLIKKGSGVTISLESNNDRIEGNEVIPSFSKSLEPDNYDFDYKGFSEDISPSPSSDNSKIVFTVKPWNDCERIFSHSDKCKNESLRRLYDRETVVLIRNIVVTRLLDDEVRLVDIQPSASSTSFPNVTYQEINPTFYKVNITGSQNRFYLIFSELFNDGWQAVFSDGTKIPEKDHFLANTYANGWIIDREGTYQIDIRLEQQKLLETGEKISEISLFAIIAVLILEVIRGIYVNKVN